MKSTDKLISVDAFFKRICDDTSIRGSAFAAIRRHLDATPAVEAQPVKHGRWIHDQVEGCSPFVDSLPIWVDVMQCSVCKEYIEGSHGSNYCPNCGAKMDGGNDDV